VVGQPHRAEAVALGGHGQLGQGPRVVGGRLAGQDQVYTHAQSPLVNPKCSATAAHQGPAASPATFVAAVDLDCARSCDAGGQLRGVRGVDEPVVTGNDDQGRGRHVGEVGADIDPPDQIVEERDVEFRAAAAPCSTTVPVVEAGPRTSASSGFTVMAGSSTFTPV